MPITMAEQSHFEQGDTRSDRPDGRGHGNEIPGGIARPVLILLRP